MSDSSLNTPGEPTHSGSGPVNNNSGLGTQTNYTLAGGVGNTQYNAQNQTIYQTATSITDAEKIAHCRKALLTTRPEDDREALISAKGKKVDGTCEWIWVNAEFQSLLRGETRLLWICGGPGKGKTMISIYLTQELEKAEQMVYCFCRAEDDRRRTAAHVIRGLVWQLATKQPELAEHLLHHLYAPEQNKEKEKEKLQLMLESREALWSLFLGMTHDTRLRTTFCLVDGLDECDEDSQQWLAAKLVQFTQESRGQNLRTIIVSRPSIVLLNQSHRIKLDPDNDLQINTDLRAFVSARTQALSELLDFSTQFREHVENTLLNRSEGTFLWVGLAIPELLQKRNWTEVKTALQSLPRGLPALYDRMILQIPEQDIHFSSMILRWVTLAVRPLSVEELGGVLQCRKSTAISTEQMVRDRISTCGSLVHIKNDIVSLVHESARDYFLRDEVSDIGALERFGIQPLEVHLEIACRCLATIEKNWQYLRKERGSYFRKYQRDWYQATLPTTPDDPLLNHAISHWPDHARQARQDFSALCKHAP